jgi:hypothetical protein
LILTKVSHHREEHKSNLNFVIIFAVFNIIYVYGWLSSKRMVKSPYYYCYC